MSIPHHPTNTHGNNHIFFTSLLFSRPESKSKYKENLHTYTVSASLHSWFSFWLTKFTNLNRKTMFYFSHHGCFNFSIYSAFRLILRWIKWTQKVVTEQNLREEKYLSPFGINEYKYHILRRKISRWFWKWTAHCHISSPYAFQNFSIQA